MINEKFLLYLPGIMCLIFNWLWLITKEKSYLNITFLNITMIFVWIMVMEYFFYCLYWGWGNEK